MMEAREVPAVALAAGATAIAHTGGSADSTVQFLNAFDFVATPSPITPFAGYRGALSVAQGDVNRDGVADVIVGAQAPNGHVKVFDGTTGALMQSFLAFAGFDGAVNVGSADVNGDGNADILVSASATNAHVKAFSGANGAPLASFFAFPGFFGQASVSGADFNGDGADEIIVGAGGVGANGRVAVFNANGSMFNAGFFAFPGFDGAISVAGGDLNRDGIADIVVGGAGGHVEAFSGANFALLDSFLAFGPDGTDGALVAMGDANHDGRADIIVTGRDSRLPGVWIFNGASGTLLTSVVTLGGDPPTFTFTQAPSEPVPTMPA